MNWRKITDEDLHSKMVQAELDAIADAKARTILNVVSKVRGYVASAGIALDADTEAIPERLISDACAVVVVDAYISLGGTLKDPNGERAQAKRDALKLFEAVGRGDYSIEDPTKGTESSGSGGVTVVKKRTPRITRDNMNGL
jgi:hypothetical protein